MDKQKVMDVLDRYGELIVNNYKQQLTNSIATGNLRNSIKYNVTAGDYTYQIQISLLNYFIYIENGRRPGKRPPIDAILNWVRVKNIIPTPMTLKSGKSIIPTQRSLAFLISRKIGEEGITPKPYLQNTFDMLLDDLERDLVEVIEKEVIIDIMAHINFNNKVI